MTTTQGLEPTQVRRPWRAVARTVLAVAVPLFLALPFILQVIVDELGDTLPPGFIAWLLLASAVCTALAAAITRILALPQVELILRSIPGAPFAAQPRPKPEGVNEPQRSGPVFVSRNGDLRFVSDPAGPALTDAEREAAGVSRRSDFHLGDGTPIPDDPSDGDPHG